MVLGGYSKLRAQMPERRTSLVKTICLSVGLVCILYVFAPARSDFNQYVLNDQTVACTRVGCKPVNLEKILMTKSEVEFVLKYVTHNVSNYLEWGSGGSTTHFPQYIKQRFVSIEHDAAWCQKMKDQMANSKGHVPVEVHCVSVPRGTGGWGKKSPFEEGDYRVFRKYIDEIEHLNQKKWDFVLIDGRARVAAAIKALSFLRSDSVVVLHDSWRMVTRYSEIRKYYDVVAETKTMWNQGIAVLRRKEKFAGLEGRKDLVQEILNKAYGTK